MAPTVVREAAAHQGGPPRPVKAITGTLAVTLALGASRWGSYLGVPPLFLTDLLIAAAVLGRVFGHLLDGARPRSDEYARPPWSPLIVVFFVYALVRLVTSPEEQLGTLVWLRDWAPYLYAALALFSASAFIQATPPQRAKTYRYLRAALIFHLLWTAASTLLGLEMGLPVLPGAPVGLFGLRTDVDSAFVGMAVGVFVRQLITGTRHPVLLGAGAILGLVTVASLATRAGLLSTVVAITVGFALGHASMHSNRGRSLMLTAIVPSIAIGGVLALTLTLPGQRLLASAGIMEVQTAGQANAVGTTQARSITWQRVLDYTIAEQSTALWGFGFGPDFITASGSYGVIAGTVYDGVRSPHNWIVGTVARLGLVGGTMAVLILLVPILVVWRCRHTIGPDPLLTLCAVVVIGMIPVALLGVVLESPFGAVPFWWCLGILLGHARRRRLPVP